MRKFSKILGKKIIRFLNSDYFLFFILFIIIAINFNILNIHKMGFYHDDWYEISRFANPESIKILFEKIIASKQVIYVRPIPQVIYSILIAYFPNKPIVFHIILVFIDFFIALGWFLVLKKFVKNKIFSFLIAVIIAIYPTKNSSMFWPISGLFAGLEQIFFIFSLYLSILYFENKKISTLIISLLLYLTGIFCYNATLLFSPLFFIYPIFYTSKKKEKWKNILRYFPYLLISFLSILYLRLFAIRFTGKSVIFFNLKNYIFEAGNALDRNLSPKLFQNYFYRIMDISHNNIFIFYLIILIFVFSIIFILHFREIIKNDIKESKYTVLYLGIILFLLSILSITFTNYRSISFGLPNRVNIFISAGIFLMVSFFILSIGRRTLVSPYLFFSLLILIFSLTNVSATKSYAEANRIQKQIREIVIQNRDIFSNQDAVLLGLKSTNVNGDTLIFDASWDFAGFIRYNLKLPDILGNVINNRMKIENDYIYDPMGDKYYYGKIIFLDYEKRELIKIESKEQMKDILDQYIKS